MTNQANDSHDRIEIGLGIAPLAVLAGRVGHVDGGCYGPVVATEPVS